MKKLLLSLIFLSFPFLLLAQKWGTITGKISDAQGTPLEGITIHLAGTPITTATDQLGLFALKVHAGKYRLVIGGVGFRKIFAGIEVHPGQHLQREFILSPDNIQLGAVQIKNKAAITEIRESPFNVVVLDAKSQYNSTLDLGHLLAKSSGIRIREAGGVGGDLNVTLNGFTGRNIKIFMDGVPMQGNSSSFQLNNIPVSLAERIEVYKGVVPVEFGGDAIGGAINIVTNRTTNTFLDASYSYGSFNTHRTNLMLGHTTPKGFSIQLNAYQNYSDNDYKIKSRLITNGQYSRDTSWYKRFHGGYHNETVVAKVGWVNKAWADRFFIGATVSQDYQEVQNAPANVEFVYGDVHSRSKGYQPNMEYYKRNLFVNGLTVRASGTYNFNSNQSVDTSSYKYNWLGEKSLALSKGERGVTALSDYNNSNYAAMANVSYELNQAHAITLNDVQSGSTRKITSTATEEALSEYEKLRRLSLKNVLGLNYRYRPNKQWNISVFGKNYYQKVRGPYNAGDEAHPDYLERDAGYSTMGYGAATTYFWRSFQFKASAERAYRLPSDNELFGDENSEVGNATLRAENSLNYNLGFTLNQKFKNADVLYLDLNGFYRNTDDFIKREILVRTGTLTSVNFGNARNLGLDMEVRYYFGNKAMLGGTFSIMNLYDNEQYRGSEGNVLNTHYKDRMPNVPYQFGNLDAAYYFHNIGGKKAGNTLNLEYNLGYVYKFFLNWESMGNAANKYTLPTQISHDFSATYMIKGGKYNFSVEARNIGNAELADNFAMLKPGRAFYGKFRIYLMKRRKQTENNQ
jgi:outer membrane receptor protein involved in Fe transport